MRDHRSATDSGGRWGRLSGVRGQHAGSVLLKPWVHHYLPPSPGVAVRPRTRMKLSGRNNLNWVNGTLDMKKHQGVYPKPRNFWHQGPKSKMATGTNIKNSVFHQSTKNVIIKMFLGSGNMILVLFWWLEVKFSFSVKIKIFYLFHLKSSIFSL